VTRDPAGAGREPRQSNQGSHAHPTALILGLQGAVGNQAVQRLLATRQAPPTGKLAGPLPSEDEMPPVTGRSASAPARRPEQATPDPADEEKPRLRHVTVSGPDGRSARGAASGRVGFKTITGPKGECGGMQWVIQWVLDKASKKGGWIVQHVKTAFDVKDAAGAAVDVKAHVGVDPANWPLWEAWKVNAGKKVTTYAEGGDLADDAYGMPSFGATTGKYEITGTAEFYEGLKLPAAFAPDSTSPAGILPVTKTKPSLSGGTGAVDHSLTATWDCTAPPPTGFWGRLTSRWKRRTKVKTS
jgi:hypothetical protein